MESDTNIRRYLALRFCTPNPRKGNRKAADNDLVTVPGGLVLRSKKELVGFVLSEYDVSSLSSYGSPFADASFCLDHFRQSIHSLCCSLGHRRSSRWSKSFDGDAIQTSGIGSRGIKFG